jgi:hypothetical protein
MRAFRTVSLHGIVAVGVCSVNLLLFSMVPAMRRTITDEHTDTQKQRLRVVADVVPPKKKIHQEKNVLLGAG